jgi:hypothetical protein
MVFGWIALTFRDVYFYMGLSCGVNLKILVENLNSPTQR